MTSDKRLDFGGDAYRDTDTGILNGIFTTRIAASVRIFLILQNSSNSYAFFVERWDISVANKPFGFGADADHEQVLGIFEWNF